MSKFFLVPYSCSGDQLALSGFVHYLLEEKKATNICILSVKSNYEMVRHLYEDYANVIVFPVDSDYSFRIEKQKFEALPKDSRDGYELIAFGNHGNMPDFKKLDPYDLNCLYLQHGVPKGVRFTHFRLPKNLEISNSVYLALINKIGSDYVVIHDDPSRIMILNYEKIKVWLRKNNMSDYPIIYLGNKRYNYPLMKDVNNPDVASIIDIPDILNLTHILRNAKACHMMDSSFAILLDYVADPSSDQKRVSYKRWPEKDNRPIYHIPWEYEEDFSMTNEFDAPYGTF